MKKPFNAIWTNMTRFMATGLIICSVSGTVFTAHGAPQRSKGVPSGWIEDFRKAKEAATREYKHILMCSVDSGNEIGRAMFRNVYSKGRFTSKLKNRFILMMVDTTSNAKNLSAVALVQNSHLRDHYRLEWTGGCCVVDKDGNGLKTFRIADDVKSCLMRIEAETNALPPPIRPSAAGRAQTGKSQTGSTSAVWDARRDVKNAELKAEKMKRRIEEIARKYPLYCVIDLSGGPEARSWNVTEMSEIPKGGWTDEYKTEKIVLRRIDPGTFIMGENPMDETRRVEIG